MNNPNKVHKSKMGKEVHKFSKKKDKKSFAQKNQPDFNKTQKKPKMDNSSILESTDDAAVNLKSLFAELLQNKKGASKSPGMKKQPKVKKYDSFEFSGNKPKKEEIMTKKRKRTDVSEELPSNIERDYSFELSGKKFKKQEKTILNKKREKTDASAEPPSTMLKISKKMEENTTPKTISNKGSENNDLKNAKLEERKLKNQQQNRDLQRSYSKEIKQRVKDEKARMCRTLYVGNLPKDITKKGLEKIFKEYGTLESARLRGAIPQKINMPKKIAEFKRSFHSGLQSRMGFVVFQKEESAANALALNGQLIQDHHIVVNLASSNKEKKTYDNQRSIFVGNLPFSVEDEVVWNTFSQFGDVEAVRVIRDTVTGAGKGFGYVLFKNTEAKQNALNKESLEIEERPIRIKDVEAGKKDNSSSSQNFAKNRALRLKHKGGNPNSRKSVKKIMNREKIHYEKKKVANTFKKYF